MASEDIEYLRMAYRAAENSLDPNTQVGAVLLTTDGHRFWAWNQLPSAKLERERAGYYHSLEKDTWVHHAERQLICTAARLGNATQGATMYVSWAACTQCALAIIAAGIKDVVSHDHPAHHLHERWLAEVLAGREMLREAGVGLRLYGDRLGVKFRFNGRIEQA